MACCSCDHHQPTCNRVDGAKSFEPVAIIGMGCRWPGGSTQPSELWDFLKAGKQAYRDFPTERMNVDAFFHQKKGRPGSFYTRGGCFLDSNPYDFDNSFFGINPQEALHMDPCQRKLLEAVYEAFESSGTPLEKLSGSKTGVFVGNFNGDHQLMQYHDSEYPEPYSVTGGGITILSNRINYIFNLKGPSLTLDTACSSSMYALHLACSSIQNGDCDSAIVGSSNLLLLPDAQIFSSSLGAVSATSKCHTFDAAADGYARADGIGALYIKKLADAVRDRDPVRAVIRGTAANANGRTGGISHPSSDGQEAAIREAYERAGNLDYSMTGYVECHGTGTPVGDPLEIAALGRVFAPGRSSSNALLIGSIKSNIGHSEPASGIAGVMKTVLALENGVIPPITGFKDLNPNVDLKKDALKVVTTNTSWPDLPVRRASVNSFGYGGANAHVILEAVSSYLPGYETTRKMSIQNEPETINSPQDHAHQPYASNGTFPSSVETNIIDGRSDSTYKKVSRERFLVPFSAHNDRTLQAYIAAIRTVGDKYRMVDLAYTLAVRRTTFRQRSFVVTAETGFNESLSRENVVVQKTQWTTSPRIGFVFTGQGAQWSRMGLDLMNSFPSYLSTIRRLDNYLAALRIPPKWTLEDTFRMASTDEINKAERSQPATTAVQIAVVVLLMSWNITPVVTVGHSSGEIGAAYAAGQISMKDAILLAFLRGKSADWNTSKGLMLAIGCGETVARATLKGKFDNITIACYNSPESITLSGNSSDILASKIEFDNQKIFTRILSTGGNAYHCPHMIVSGQFYQEEILKNCLTTAKTELHLPKVHFISSVTGKSLEFVDVEASYWKRNLESPVLFSQAIDGLLRTTAVDALVEIGPHAALRSSLQQIAKSWTGVGFPTYCPTLIREKDSTASILSTAGTLWANGYPVNLERVNAIESWRTESGDILSLQTGSTIADLPRYQWQYEKTMLLENRRTREWRLRRHARHDILGSRIPGNSKTDPTWRNILRHRDVSWLDDHRLGTEIIFPAAGYLTMAIEAITQIWEDDGDGTQYRKGYKVHNVALLSALVVPEDDRGIETLLTIHPVSLNNNSNHNFQYGFVIVSVLHADGEDKFVEHARGQVGIIPIDGIVKHTKPKNSDFHRRKIPIPALQWYENFSHVGLNYGPRFRRLTNINAPSDSNVVEAEMQLASALAFEESRYVYHPAVLDNLLQLSLIAAHASMPHRLQKRFLPRAFGSITIQEPSPEDLDNPAQIVASAELRGVRGLASEIAVTGADGRVLVSVEDLFFLAADNGPSISTGNHNPYLRMSWKPDFDLLTSEVVKVLFPLAQLDEAAGIAPLNNLALHQITQFYVTYPEIFANGSDKLHLQHFINWVVRKIELSRQDRTPHGRKILDYSTEERAAAIRTLSSTLNVHSPESRTMCKIYENLPSIFSGEKTGIEVALQDDLLFEMYAKGKVITEGNRRLAKIVELCSHQHADARILEIGAGTGSATWEILAALRGNTVFRNYKEYVFTDITPSFLLKAEESFQAFRGVNYSTFDMEIPAIQQNTGTNYDILVASNVVHAASDVLATVRNLRSLLRVGGKLILLELTQAPLFAGLLLGTFSDFWNGNSDPQFPRHDGPFMSKSSWATVFTQAGFNGLDFYLDDYMDHPSSTVLVATAVELRQIPNGLKALEIEGLTLIYRDMLTASVSAFGKYIQSQDITVELLSLSSVQTPKYDRILSFIEIEKPLFIDIKQEEWKALQMFVKHSSSMFWVTNGGLMSGREPLFSMFGGIARGLKTERNRLQISVFDLDQNRDSLDEGTYKTILDLLRNVSDESSNGYNIEYRQREGVIFRGCLQPDDALNEKWQFRAKHQTSAELLPLSRLDKTPLQLDIDKPHVLSTMFFHDDPYFNRPLPNDHVEIKVAAAGINNKDIAVLNGTRHSNNSSSECAGTVTRIGQNVSGLVPGDRVFCLSFGKFGNYVRERESSCQKLDEHDSFEDMATMPLAFCTAIYGLMNLAHLSKGETVLILSGAGGVGYAAIQISILCGAEVYVTVSTEEKKQELLGRGFGIQPDRVFWSREKNAANTILERTCGKGMDVVLSNASAELMHEYWRCLGSFGRFVDIGRIEVMNSGRLDMKGFLRNATFTSFDMEMISNERPEIVKSLITTLGDLYRQGSVRAIPFVRFPISEIEEAFKTFAKDARTGKVVVTYDDKDSLIKYRTSSFKTQLDPNAAYLLVGCLGGLGRRYSKWMIERGARNLIYLSRSGYDNDEAREFLDQLQAQNVAAQIVKGDVTSLNDVTSAVTSTTRSIKGVVQAALTLKDELFETMTLDMFNATVRPRVMGTINLHLALVNSPLDFFMMWSSWTAQFGTATQTNYLSSCAFMDAFARYRQSLGLPATSLSLSRIGNVGAIARNRNYANSLARNGLYGNNEDEFLHYCESAIGRQESQQSQWDSDPLTRAHLLAGIDPAGLQKLDRTHPIRDMGWYHDLRFSNLVRAVDVLSSSKDQSGMGTSATSDESDGPVVERIRKKAAQLLYIPVDSIDVGRPITEYGIDSMIAAELRNWLFNALAKDVSLFEMLSPAMTVEKLAKEVEERKEKFA